MSRNGPSRVVIYRQERQCRAEETIPEDFAASDKRRRERLAEKFGVRNNSQNMHNGNVNLHSNGHFCSPFDGESVEERFVSRIRFDEIVAIVHFRSAF